MDAAKILIVEDNTTVAEDARECLEGLGYVVTDIAASGEEAVESAGRNRPDAVLMDIKLRGEMDGIEAANRIRAEFDIPVLFLSAYSDRELLERAKKTGSFGYLVKPFEERELFAMLETTLYKANADKERRETDARLRRCEKMEALGGMAGGVAHHFNNKLAAVIGNLELALEDLPSEASAFTFVAEARRAAVESARMSQFMLAFNGFKMIEKAPLDLGDVCRRWLDRHRGFFPETVRLHTAISSPGPIISANEAQIEALLEALLANARQAMRPDSPGRVSVTVAVREALPAHCGFRFPPDWGDAGKPCACLEIADDGRGMSATTMEKIFDPFFTRDFFARPGLGLCVVWGNVKSHDGCVAVESQPGRGSVFSLFFPLLPQDTQR